MHPVVGFTALVLLQPATPTVHMLQETFDNRLGLFLSRSTSAPVVGVSTTTRVVTVLLCLPEGRTSLWGFQAGQLLLSNLEGVLRLR